MQESHSDGPEDRARHVGIASGTQAVGLGWYVAALSVLRSLCL